MGTYALIVSDQPCVKDSVHQLQAHTFTNIPKYCFNTSNGTEVVAVSPTRMLLVFYLHRLAILQLSQARSALQILFTTDTRVGRPNAQRSSFTSEPSAVVFVRRRHYVAGENAL